MPSNLIVDGVLYGVSAVIFDSSEKVLMLYRSGKGEVYKSSWEFIKGGLLTGENHFQAALREIREEAGPIEVEFITELPKNYLVDTRYRKKTYSWVEKKSLVFYYLGGEVHLDGKEHIQFEWMSITEACASCWVEYGAEILQDAYNAFKQWQGS